MGGVAGQALGGAPKCIIHFRMQLWQEPRLHDFTFVLPTVLAARDNVAKAGCSRRRTTAYWGIHESLNETKHFFFT